jgi:MoxR-like ATPase
VSQQVVTPEELSAAREVVDRIRGALDSRLVGQEEMATSLLVALLARGHVLVESVPGLAKSLAASTLAQAVDASFSRIQCTPDLLPSDIIGTQVFDARNSSFETRLGPVHANFVLLDEVNRASAKTQSAMLEAMQERQTSIGGRMHRLPAPFMVLATQNPIEEEGTYVLPHAQLDRFLVKTVITHPSAAEELEVLARIESGVLGSTAEPVAAVATLEDVELLQSLTRRVYVAESVRRYMVDLVGATRHLRARVGDDSADAVEFGASPRGTIAFFEVSRALALLAGRNHVVPEDIRRLAPAVLRHRLVLTFEAIAARVRPETVIDALVAAVPTP